MIDDVSVGYTTTRTTSEVIHSRQGPDSPGRGEQERTGQNKTEQDRTLEKRTRKDAGERNR